MNTTLALPSIFDPKNASRWGYSPNIQTTFEAAIEARRNFGIKAAATDRFRLRLLMIDAQKDFCFPEGTLFVGGRSGTGAIDDNRRLAEFIYRNLPWITDIDATFDTHFAFQIFFASFWIDDAGNPLSPHTLIVAGQNGQLDNVDLGGKVIAKNVRPNPALAAWLARDANGKGNYTWLLKQVQFYVAELARAGKYTLYLWPFHCVLGSDGHALAGVIQEARLFHGFARGAQSNSEIKGGHPLTENYSVLRPEVLLRWDGVPLAQKNARFIETLLESDAVAIAGQAASHCVKSTIDDLLDEIVAKDASLAKKVYVMTDTMSAVAVTDGKGGFAADFTPQAEAAFQRFADAGMNLVKSTDPLQSWPDLKLAA